MAIKTNFLKKYLKIETKDLKLGTYKVDSSLKPFKCRAYGYKNKPYQILVVSSIKRGGIEAKIPARGRTPSKIYKNYSRNISLQRILQNRVARRYLNLELVRSYLLHKNGKRAWYEHYFVDPHLKMILDLRKAERDLNVSETSR